MASLNSAPIDPPDVRDDEIQLSDLLEKMLQGKWWILGVYTALILLASIVTFLQDPMYEATSMVHVEGETSMLGDISDLGLGSGSSIETQVYIVRSRTIAQQVVRLISELGENPLSGRPFNLFDLGEGDRHFDPVETLMEDLLQVETVEPDVDLITITISSAEPADATYLANLYADEYERYDRRVSRQGATSLREFFDQQVGRLDSIVRSQEGQYIEFLSGQSVVAPETEAQVLVQQIQALQQEVYETESDRRGAEATLVGLEREIERLQPGIQSQLRSANLAIIEQLQKRIAEFSGELEVFYARNPALRLSNAPGEEVAKLRENIQVLQNRVDEAAAEIANDVSDGVPFSGSGSGLGERVADLVQQAVQARIALSAASASQSVLTDAISDARRRINNLPQQNVYLERYTRSVERYQEGLAEFQRQQQLAQAAEQSEVGDVRVVDYAILPYEPVSPRPLLYLLLAAFVGFLGGTAGVLVVGALDSKVRRPDDLRAKGLNVLAVVPDMSRTIEQDFGGAESVETDSGTYGTSLLTLLNPLSPITESFRRLRTTIEYSRPDASPRIIQVSSPGPGEGKSTVSSNLAVAMAQAGHKTLYLDADMRRPTAHRVMGVSREPGLVEFLFGEEERVLASAVTSIEGLSVMPTGRKTSVPGELLGSQKMRDAMKVLVSRFDFVIIDTPPVLAVNDASLVAFLADYTLLVASTNDTSLADLDRAVETLASVGQSVDGIVLNRFDAQRAYGYSYGSKGYGYGSYQYGTGV